MRRWLDLAIGLLAVLLPAGLLLADQVQSALVPGKHIKITPSLIGVTMPIDPEPSLDRVLDGAWQGDFGRMIGSRTPFYPLAVRLKQQILYSVFGVAGIPGVMVGRGGALIEREYAREYCSRDLGAFAPVAKDWAAKLRQMQDAFEKHGKTFLYVLTPSKVAQYPDLLPVGYLCPAPQADRAGLVPLWRDDLTAAGVHFVDTTAVVSAAHGRYPFRLYPRAGTHWNGVGAALATNAMVAAVDRLRGDGLLPPLHVDWHMVGRPPWPDMDLDQMMNLLHDRPREPGPQVTLSGEPPAGGCRKLSVAIVGGSFMNVPGGFLADGPCHPAVEEWQYWSVYDITWPPGVDWQDACRPGGAGPQAAGRGCGAV